MIADFCFGNGSTGESWETAFVLENFTISVADFTDVINFNYISVYTIIRNCNLTGENGLSQRGILLENCQNILIEHCQISAFTVGIFLLSNNSNIIIRNNTISYNQEGITNAASAPPSSSSALIIEENLIYNNARGIQLNTCEICIISNNQIENNTDYGIYLQVCTNITVQDNNVSHNTGTGISMGNYAFRN